jgi:hypothetical protein
VCFFSGIIRITGIRLSVPLCLCLCPKFCSAVLFLTCFHGQIKCYIAFKCFWGGRRRTCERLDTRFVRFSHKTTVCDRLFENNSNIPEVISFTIFYVCHTTSGHRFLCVKSSTRRREVLLYFYSSLLVYCLLRLTYRIGKVSFDISFSYPGRTSCGGNNEAD